MKYKAFLIDSDDTLTRVPDVMIYRRATYNAYKYLMPEGEHMLFDAFSQLHGAMYEAGQCHFSGFAERFRLQVLALFRSHHDHMEIDSLLFDTASAAALDAVADRAVIFTDGTGNWAQRCGARIGHSLEVLARDDRDHLAPIKAVDPARWFAALDILSQKTGEKLVPGDVLMIDDSARVLRYAQSLGFGTAQCHYGNPGRTPNAEFDYNIDAVGEFLIEQGYATRPAQPLKIAANNLTHD